MSKQPNHLLSSSGDSWFYSYQGQNSKEEQNTQWLSKNVRSCVWKPAFIHQNSSKDTLDGAAGKSAQHLQAKVHPFECDPAN